MDALCKSLRDGSYDEKGGLSKLATVSIDYTKSLCMPPIC